MDRPIPFGILLVEGFLLLYFSDEFGMGELHCRTWPAGKVLHNVTVKTGVTKCQQLGKSTAVSTASKIIFQSLLR